MAGSTIPPNKLDQLVLTTQEMPGFAPFYQGPQLQIDNQGTNRTNPTRFGREGGWILRLRRAEPAQTTGPLVIESRADLFKTIEGAKSDFGSYRTLLLGYRGENGRPIGVSGLGSDSAGVTFTEAGTRTLRFYRIAWRDRNATASILVEGFDGSVTQQQALALAQKQEVRIKGE